MSASGIEQVLATEQRLQEQLRTARDDLQREHAQRLLALKSDESRWLTAALEAIDAEIARHFRSETTQAQHALDALRLRVERLDHVTREEMVSVVRSHLRRRVRGDAA